MSGAEDGPGTLWMSNYCVMESKEAKIRYIQHTGATYLGLNRTDTRRILYNRRRIQGALSVLSSFQSVSSILYSAASPRTKSADLRCTDRPTRGDPLLR